MELREIVLDTETTGLSTRQGHRVIEIGCVEIIGGVITGNHYHTYVNARRDVPDEAYKVHGISAEFLQDKPVFPLIARDFLQFINTSNLVIHNAAFDLSFLNHELGLLGETPIEGNRVTDTLMMARKRFPGSPASLDALCQRFNISLSKRDKHGALVDAELTAMVYLCLRADGKQVKLGFDQVAVHKEQKDVRPARLFAASADEVQQHQQLIKRIPNALWKEAK